MFEYLSSSNQSFGQHYFILTSFQCKELNCFKQLESVFPVSVTV